MVLDNLDEYAEKTVEMLKNKTYYILFAAIVKRNIAKICKYLYKIG